MFLIVCRPGASIAEDLGASILRAKDTIEDLESWISADRSSGAVWSRGTLASLPGQDQAKDDHANDDRPKDGSPFAIAETRLDPWSTCSVTGSPEHILVARYILSSTRPNPTTLYGDFAIAKFDRNQLYLAVDQSAVRSIFFTANSTGFAASTDLRALLAYQGSAPELNAETLALLVPGYLQCDSGETAFRTIQKLPGAHQAYLSCEGVQIDRWWNLDQLPERRLGDARRYTSEIGHLFEQAVQSRLPSNGPVGATLSGGLDSTLVTAYAAGALARENRAVHAWTAVPHPLLTPEERTGWTSSDWKFASKLAAAYPNVRHDSVSPEGICLLDTLAAIHRSSATPVRNSANMIWFMQICSASREQGCHRVLTGENGNGTVSLAGFGGLTRLLFTGRWARLFRHIRQHPKKRFVLFRDLLHFSLGEQGTLKLRQRLGHAPNPSLALAKLLRPNLAKLYREAQALRRTARSERLWLGTRPRHSFAPDFQAHAGVRMLDPTGDRRLTEYLLGCPVDAFIDDGWERLQARLLGEGRVPDEIRWRRDRGEQAPEEAGFFTLYPDRYREVWSEIRHLPWLTHYFDSEACGRALEALIQGQPVPDARYIAMALHRIFDIGMFTLYIERQFNRRAAAGA